MGCAVHSTLEAGQTFTTVEMKTNFVKAVRENTGKLRCEGVLLHAGTRIARSEGKIFNSAGDLGAQLLGDQPDFTWLGPPLAHW